MRSYLFVICFLFIPMVGATAFTFSAEKKIPHVSAVQTLSGISLQAENLSQEGFVLAVAMDETQLYSAQSGMESKDLTGKFIFEIISLALLPPP